MRQRIGAVIRAYEAQGFHRTGTEVDRTIRGVARQRGARDRPRADARGILAQPGRSGRRVSRGQWPQDRRAAAFRWRLHGSGRRRGSTRSLLGAMRPSPSPNSRRMPQRPARWVKRAGKTGIGRLSSSRAARSRILPEQCRQLSAAVRAAGAASCQRGSVFPCRLRAGRCESRADGARRTHGGAGIQCRGVGLRVEQRRGATGRDDAAKRMVELRKRARRRVGVLAGDHARRARCEAGQGRPVCRVKRS